MKDENLQAWVQRPSPAPPPRPQQESTVLIPNWSPYILQVQINSELQIHRFVPIAKFCLKLCLLNIIFCKDSFLQYIQIDDTKNLFLGISLSNWLISLHIINSHCSLKYIWPKMEYFVNKSKVQAQPRPKSPRVNPKWRSPFWSQNSHGPTH